LRFGILFLRLRFSLRRLRRLGKFDRHKCLHGFRNSLFEWGRIDSGEADSHEQ